MGDCVYQCVKWVQMYMYLFVDKLFGKIYQGARGSSVVWANFEFRQKVVVSKSGGNDLCPGGKISEMTSQIMFGYVLTRVLLCECVENMV